MKAAKPNPTAASTASSPGSNSANTSAVSATDRVTHSNSAGSSSTVVCPMRT